MSKLTPSQQAVATVDGYRAQQQELAAQQVDTIAKLMATGQWRGMRSRRELAELWGIHERTVGYRAQEASAFLKRVGKPIEQVIMETLDDLEDIQAEALEQGELDIARKAVMDRATVRGVVGPAKRTTAPVDEASKDYATMTPAERIEAHRSAIAEEEARLSEEQRKGGVH